jgi:SPP1 family predicted phage head-tail adaptor
MAGVGQRKQIQLIKVDNQKRANGSWGEPVKTRYNYWAEVLRNGGSRSFQSSTRMGSDYRFRVRYNGTFDLSAKWVVVYDSKELTVQNIERDKEKQFYYIIDARCQS